MNTLWTVVLLVGGAALFLVMLCRMWGRESRAEEARDKAADRERTVAERIAAVEMQLDAYEAALAEERRKEWDQ